MQLSVAVHTLQILLRALEALLQFKFSCPSSSSYILFSILLLTLLLILIFIFLFIYTAKEAVVSERSPYPFHFTNTASMSWQTHLDTIDAESASLIARLQLEDVMSNLGDMDREEHAEESYDARLALEMYLNELDDFQATHQTSHATNPPSIFDVVVANTTPLRDLELERINNSAAHHGYRQRIKGVIGVAWSPFSSAYMMLSGTVSGVLSTCGAFQRRVFPRLFTLELVTNVVYTHQIVCQCHPDAF